MVICGCGQHSLEIQEVNFSPSWAFQVVADQRPCAPWRALIFQRRGKIEVGGRDVTRLEPEARDWDCLPVMPSSQL